jgi:hypothetical protein
LSQGELSFLQGRLFLLQETFPCRREGFPGCKESFPCVKEGFPCSKETFPCRRESFPDFKESFPCAKEGFPCSKEAFPRRQASGSGGHSGPEPSPEAKGRRRSLQRPDSALQAGADGGGVSGWAVRTRIPEVGVGNHGWIWGREDTGGYQKTTGGGVRWRMGAYRGSSMTVWVTPVLGTCWQVRQGQEGVSLIRAAENAVIWRSFIELTRARFKDRLGQAPLREEDYAVSGIPTSRSRRSESSWPRKAPSSSSATPARILSLF